ncbi:Mor transcription activator family protein [Methylomonas sp. 2BW1-5-20]|uniref:Mor transcription activator family protein n=1 Tax=Methylomonas sp. 2BW1-5-20 TaxID=3376686 RepID=UPI004051087A
MNTPLPKHLLPDSLLQIAEYCGEETMWLIWRAYGGGHLTVPVNVTPDHRLAELLGMELAAKFCEMFGGATVYQIPKAHAAMLAMRNERIRHDRSNGMDNFRLCRKYGLTERQIITIVGQVTPAAINFDLFED